MTIILITIFSSLVILGIIIQLLQYKSDYNKYKLSNETIKAFKQRYYTRFI